MEETVWMNKEKGFASNPNSWSNGVPHYRKTAVFEGKAIVVWDLNSISIPIDIMCNPDLIEIEGLDEYCKSGDSFFAPDIVVTMYRMFIDGQTLDKPPPDLNVYGETIHFKFDEDFDFDESVDSNLLDWRYEGNQELIINIKNDGYYPYEVKDNNTIWVGDVKYYYKDFLRRWNELFPQGLMATAAFTAKASGDWDATGQTTWNEVGFPATTDTVAIGSGHNIRIDAGTGNEACLSCDVQTGGTLTIDSESGGALSLTFDDTAGAGFAAASAGQITYVGTSGNLISITSAGAPPTNYWNADVRTGNCDVTMAYTTMTYGFQFSTGGTWDIDNCTFDLFKTNDYVVRMVSGTITAFNNNTLSNSRYGIRVGITIDSINNMTVTTMTTVEITAWTGVRLELTNSNWNISNRSLLSGAIIISSAHNDVSGAWYYMASTTGNKSVITNDFTSSDNVTIYEGTLVVDEASASISVEVESGATFKIDAVGAGMALTHTFTDNASSGFVTSAGAFIGAGDITNGATVTSAGAPPTYHWDGTTTMDVTADYTTFSYYDTFQTNGTWDVDNCTFSEASVNGVYIPAGSTITSFDDNIILNSSGSSFTSFTEITASPIDNLTITNPGANSIAVGADLELTNSTFDESIAICNPNRYISSDVHNKIANAYALIMDEIVGAVLKSDITNDFGSTDNVTIYAGELVCDEATAHRDMTIKSGATLDVNPLITETVTNTGTMTVESGGTIDWTGTSGNLITLVSDSPATQWSLNAISGSTVTCSYLDVTDSDATLGLLIDASDGTNVDGGNNDNCNFGGVTTHFSIDAILVDRFTETFSVDAFLQKTDSEIFPVDAILVDRLTEVFPADAILQKTDTEVFPVDATLVNILTEAFPVDAILVDRLTGVFPTDAILVNRNTEVFSVDAILIDRLTEIFSVDAFLQKTDSEVFTVDAFLWSSGTEVFSVDAILQKTDSEVFTADAVLVDRLTEVFPVDAILIDRLTEAFTVDALLQETKDEVFSVDAILQKTDTEIFTVDAILIGIFTEAFTVDAILIDVAETEVFTVDAILQKTDSEVFSIDAMLQATYTEIFSVDAILIKQDTEIFTVDATLVDRLTETFTVDALLRGTFTETFSVDALLVGGVYRVPFSVDAILTKTVAVMKHYTLKYKIEVNGVELQSPSRITIRKRGNYPAQATLTLPNKYGKYNNYFGNRDLFAIYFGLDYLEGTAPFLGVPIDMSGRTVLTVKLGDMMSLLNRPQTRLWEHDNYDGYEAGFGIRKLVDDLDLSGYDQQFDTTGIQGTNPKVILDDTLRFPKLTSNWKIIQDINNRCWDDSGYPLTPLAYALWMTENRINFRKMQRTSDATAVIEYNNVDDLLSSKPSKSLMPVINKATVIGAQYTDVRTGEKKNYMDSYTHESAVVALGLNHQVYSFKELTSKWQCKQKAARIVMASKAKVITSTIAVEDLFMAIPNITVLSVEDSMYGIEGNNVVSELNITAGEGGSQCVATLNNIEPVMVKYL